MSLDAGTENRAGRTKALLGTALPRRPRALPLAEKMKIEKPPFDQSRFLGDLRKTRMPKWIGTGAVNLKSA